MSQGNPSGRAHTGPQLLRHPQWSYCPGTTCPLAQQSGNSAAWKDHFFNAILQNRGPTLVRFPHNYAIQMSHWSHKIVYGAKFWISCEQLWLSRKSSHWQFIQNSAQSAIVWHQLLPKISKIIVMVHQGQLVRWQLYDLKRQLFYFNYSKALRYTDLTDALVFIRLCGFEPHIFYWVSVLYIDGLVKVVVLSNDWSRNKQRRGWIKEGIWVIKIFKLKPLPSREG